MQRKILDAKSRQSRDTAAKLLWCLALLGALACSSCNRTRDNNTQPKAVGVDNRAQEIEARYESKIEAASQQLNAANDEPARNVAAQELMKLQREMANELLEVVRQDPSGPKNFELLRKLVALGTALEAQNAAAELLIAHHVTKAGLSEDASIVANANPELGLKFARAIVDKNPNPQDKAFALLIMGSTLKRQAVAEKSDLEKRANLIAAAREAFETLLDKYGELKAADLPIGRLAQGQLVGLKNLDQLTTGKPVPDIVGVDLDGQRFSLLDYRGKVILLDFWAHW